MMFSFLFCIYKSSRNIYRSLSIIIFHQLKSALLRNSIKPLFISFIFIIKLNFNLFPKLGRLCIIKPFTNLFGSFKVRAESRCLYCFTPVSSIIKIVKMVVPNRYCGIAHDILCRPVFTLKFRLFYISCILRSS